MGMAASQARLLSITARLSNNENTSEDVAYAKQRLADQTHQITNEYNEALKATKLTMLTGFNGAEANYEDISYSGITGLRMAESTKQYVVTDKRGRILVTESIADAYERSGGNFNKFLALLDGTNDGGPYSQADITVQYTKDPDKRTAEHDATELRIHEAWDKYFDTVGIDLEVEEGKYNEHQNTNEPEFQFTETFELGTGSYAIGEGYVSYRDKSGIFQPINYVGSTKESKDLYDYAMAITEAYLRTNEEGSGFNIEYPLDTIKSAADANNNSAIKYYRNIFNRIQKLGFVTYTDTASKASTKDHKGVYIYSETTKGTNKIVRNPLKDNYTFEEALRDGSLRLEYYSSTDKDFRTTTISEDNCIQEVPDERAIAQAETKYTQDMADLENKDKKFDLELKKLDTEHKALETEYESVKNVVDKNVESSFKIFS